MAIEAPVSKFKKNNLKIYIAFCILLGAWCAYDGYFNQDWIADHTDADGNPETYLVFNRYAPFVLGVFGIGLGGHLYFLGKRKIVADENELIINGSQRISYDSIESINKTHFESKGFFIITYKDSGGGETNHRISDKGYDNLAAVLDHLIVKIS